MNNVKNTMQKINFCCFFCLLWWSNMCSAWTWPDILYISPGQTWRSPPIELSGVSFDGNAAIGTFGKWDLLDFYLVPRNYNLGTGLNWVLIVDSGSFTPTGKSAIACTAGFNAYYGTPAAFGDTRSGSAECSVPGGVQDIHSFFGGYTGTGSVMGHVEITNTNVAGSAVNITWPSIYGVIRPGASTHGYAPDYWSTSGWVTLVQGGKSGKVVSTGLIVNVSPTNIIFKSKVGDGMAKGNTPTDIFVSTQTDGSSVPVGLSLAFSDGNNTISTSSSDVSIHGSFDAGASCSTSSGWLSSGGNLYIPIGSIDNVSTINKKIYWVACIAGNAPAQQYSASVEYHVSVY